MQSSKRIKLKVCGMRDTENIRKVAALHPDYMGFIFYPGSKRVVGQNFEIPEDLPSGIRRVGVFVNEETLLMLNQAKKHSLDMIQLHGTETVQQCAELKTEGLRVIKAFSIGGDFDFDVIRSYKNSVDYFLFDTKGPGYGGSGLTFDWKILEKYDQEVPFFLSGGLSPGNILEIEKLKGMNIHALDINSGVELQPGLKDVHLIDNIRMALLNNHWIEY